VHLKLKLFALLVASSLLQVVVVGSHEDRANHPFFALVGLAAQRRQVIGVHNSTMLQRVARLLFWLLSRFVCGCLVLCERKFRLLLGQPQGLSRGKEGFLLTDEGFEWRVNSLSSRYCFACSTVILNFIVLTHCCLHQGWQCIS
jgi:hypothetical protein